MTPTKTYSDYDVVVVGGGTSGVAAALSAARQGLKVALLEKRIALTGTQANAMVTPFMPSHVHGSQTADLLTERYHQMMEGKGRLTLPGKMELYSPESFKLLNDQVLREFGVEIFYDATLVSAKTELGNIESVTALIFDDFYAFEAKHFIDASGDALLSRFAGAKTEKGDKDGTRQSVSFRFEVTNIDFARLRHYLKEANYSFCDPSDATFMEFVHVPGVAACGALLDVFQTAIEAGEMTPEIARYIQGFSMPGKPNTLSFNNPQMPSLGNIEDPKTFSEYVRYGRGMQHQLLAFLNRHIPGFEDAFISQEANMLGVRESNRVMGKYIMTGSDYAARRKFEDGVARGDWYIDIHSDDLEVEDESFKKKYDKGEYYEIPYRSLVCAEVSNLIFVGRIISCDFKMQSSIRIQHTCRDMGDAAGRACALAKQLNVALNALDGSLLKQGAC
ncbi:FAD-dependent oxidoreductase [Vibrio vulnificus]|nr:FAD-dependent oxidoreductase [Vibrio vulnificus]EJV2649766.1 FAD-dependent oxidoreductase [Vibrio vulnificus]EKO5188952.1 FAD-dependent oxidoreductase [Vibrio vulnificus]MCU8322975.1 FAD-dependent oxidoreductase [Vibrio vulnificus]MCU8559399.1 FAD-dependent oxidoreductase [Vibrio vulnificus]